MDEYTTLNEKYTSLLSPYHQAYRYTKSILCHYTDLNSLVNMIETNELWFSQREYINDIDEFDYSKEILEDVFSNIGINEDNKAKIMSYLLTNKQYVFCCSTEKDVANQWMAYSSNYGYCIVFDRKKFQQFLNISKFFRVTGGKINYDNEINHKVLSLLSKYFSELRDINSSFLSSIIHEQNIIDSFMTYYGLIKKENYKYEKEYRAIVINYDREVFYRPRNGLLIPFIKIKNEEQLLPIKEIIIGPKIKDKKAKPSLLEYLEKKKYKDVNVEYSLMNMR